MSTPVNIYDITSDPGDKVLAVLLFPAGLVAGAATTVAGGALSGTSSVTAGASAIYLPLAESPSGNFSGDFTIGGTQLPDTTTAPYTIQAKVVAGGTDMTASSQATFAAAYAAANTADDIAYTRDVPPTLVNGMLASGVWGGSAAAGLTAQQVRDAMKLAPTGGAPAADSVDEVLADIASAGGAVPAELAEKIEETHTLVQSIGAVSA